MRAIERRDFPLGDGDQVGDRPGFVEETVDPQQQYETDQGNGVDVAWLPKSLTEQEVIDGRLVRALDESWDIPLDINLTRPVAPINQFAESFWGQAGR